MPRGFRAEKMFKNNRTKFSSFAFPEGCMESRDIVKKNLLNKWIMQEFTYFQSPSILWLIRVIKCFTWFSEIALNAT